MVLPPPELLLLAGVIECQQAHQPGYRERSPSSRKKGHSFPTEVLTDSRQKWRLIARPSPVPPCSLLVDASAWENGAPNSATTCSRRSSRTASASQTDRSNT